MANKYHENKRPAKMNYFTVLYNDLVSYFNSQPSISFHINLNQDCFR